MAKKVPNPAGRDGKPVKIDLPFEDALRAALETDPEPPAKKRKPRPKRKRKAA